MGMFSLVKRVPRSAKQTLSQGEVSMYVIVAPQPLKGSLTAAEAGQAIALGVCAVFPEAHVDIIPVADGGDGTVHALLEARKGEIVSNTATGPTQEPLSTFYGLLHNVYPTTIKI